MYKATKNCIICGDPITKANDSKAHVIASALGGRLKPLSIATRRGNEIVGTKIDFPLIEAFQPIMNLLNGSRDRGQTPPTPMVDETGKTYLFQFGEPLSLAAPEYEETETDNGVRITIKARTLREARILLGRAKAKNPSLDLDEVMKHAIEEHGWPEGMLGHQFQIGPRVTFPAAFVAASIFAAYHGQSPHPQLRSFVSNFDPDNPTLPPDTFFFMPEVKWIAAPHGVTHILSLTGDSASGRLLAYVELFNLVGIATILPFESARNIQTSYAIDVLSGEQVDTYIYQTQLKQMPWAATHQLGDPSLYKLTQNRFEDLLKVAQARSINAVSTKIIEKAFGRPDGRPLNAASYANLVGEVANHVAQNWKNPAVTPEMRQIQFLSFNNLCSQFESRIPPHARSEFLNLVDQHRENWYKP